MMAVSWCQAGAHGGADLSFGFRTLPDQSARAGYAGSRTTRQMALTIIGVKTKMFQKNQAIKVSQTGLVFIVRPAAETGKRHSDGCYV